MQRIRTAIGVLTLLASSHALAEIWAYGVSEDMDVAIEKANIRAAQGAQGRGTCMSEFSSEQRCNRTSEGKWQCGAAYSKYKSNCGGGQTAAEVIKESIDILNKLCSNGRESACAAAAGG